MRFSFNTTGVNQPVIREFDIDKTENIQYGQIVCINNGKVTSELMGATPLGVSAETHSGREDLLNVRSNGDKIRVIVGAGSAYQADAIYLTVNEKGSMNSIKTPFMYMPDVVNGELMLVKKAKDSINYDKIGSTRKITSYTITTEGVTFNVSNGSSSSIGDVYALFPGIGSKVKVDEKKTGIALENVETDVTFKVVDVDKDTKSVYVTMNNCLFA